MNNYDGLFPASYNSTTNNPYVADINLPRTACLQIESFGSQTYVVKGNSTNTSVEHVKSIAIKPSTTLPGEERYMLNSGDYKLISYNNVTKNDSVVWQYTAFGDVLYSDLTGVCSYILLTGFVVIIIDFIIPRKR